MKHLWTDEDVPLELFVSPTVKKAAQLPAAIKTTTEWLEGMKEHTLIPKPRRKANEEDQ